MDASQFNMLLNIATVVFTGGVFGVLLRHRYGMRGLANAEAADIRNHYAEELERVIARQHACEEREQELRKRVSELEDELAGIKRQIARYSSEQLLILDDERPPSDRAPDAVASAGRVKRITEGK